MDADGALGRVKSELSKAWLAATDRVAALAITSAEPAFVGEFEIRSVFVSREIEGAEEPLTRDPAGASRPFELWAVSWPPDTESSIGSTKFDVRESYEVLVCAACSQAGETMCGVCRGSGKVMAPKTNRPARCDSCKGKGTVVCGRCAGRGKLLRFKRINQRAKSTSTKIRLPDNAKVPTGSSSGTLKYSVRTPSGTGDAASVTAALRSAAPVLEPLGWLSVLAQHFMMASPPGGMPDARPGWRTMQGRWYEGWRLRCHVNGKAVEYFVPETGANIVGPKLRSSAKLASVVAAVTILLVGTGVVVNWRMDVAHDERVAQERVEAQRRAEEDRQVGLERAAKQEEERKLAAQRELERQQQAVAKTRQIAATFIALKGKNRAERMAGFEALSEALAETNGAAEVKSIADASIPADRILHQLRELDQLASATPALPELPEKPKFEKPEYHGAFYLDGEVRGNYEGDPVIQAGANFYVVHGIRIWFDAHYVEARPNTVTLNIGREGRDATICDVSTRETYNDDQKNYAAEVQAAREGFQKDMADYNTAVKARHEAEVKERQEKRTRDSEHAMAQSKLDDEIVKLIGALSLKP